MEQAIRSSGVKTEVFRYIVIGGINTAVGLAVILGLRLGLGVNLILANAAGYAVGLAISFCGNKTWTFGARSTSALGAVPAFLAVVSFSFLINIAAINGLMAVGIPYIAAQIAGVAVYSGLVFFGLKYYAFKS
ncbi:MAG: GtrA family protein [Pseudomonadota bacterium]